MIEAVQFGNLSTIQQFDEAVFNRVFSRGDTILHVAVGCGQLKAEQFLICQVDNVNKMNDLGWTSLHYASFSSNVRAEIFKCLLGYLSTDINCCNGLNGDTSLHCASRIDAVQKVKLLIEAGAKIEIINRCGDTPLLSVVKDEANNTVDYFLSLPEMIRTIRECLKLGKVKLVMMDSFSQLQTEFREIKAKLPQKTWQMTICTAFMLIICFVFAVIVILPVQYYSYLQETINAKENRLKQTENELQQHNYALQQTKTKLQQKSFMLQQKNYELQQWNDILQQFNSLFQQKYGIMQLIEKNLQKWNSIIQMNLNELQQEDYTINKTVHELQRRNYRIQLTQHRLQERNYTIQLAEYEVQRRKSAAQLAKHELQQRNYKLQLAESKLLLRNYTIQQTDYELQQINYLLEAIEIKLKQ